MFKFIRNTLLVGGLVTLGYTIGIARGAVKVVQATENNDYEYLKSAVELNESCKRLKEKLHE